MTGIQRQFNARFIESVTPIVKQAIQRSVSEMVVSGLSSGSVVAPPPVVAAPVQPEPVVLPTKDNVDEKADIVDPITLRSSRPMLSAVCLRSLRIFWDRRLSWPLRIRKAITRSCSRARLTVG